MSVEEKNALRLQQQLCFAAHAASRALTTRYRAGLDELGLTYTQYLVMMLLWEHGPVSLRFVCGELHLDSGTVSPMVRRLDRAGFLTRRRSVADERLVEIAPTSAGIALEQRAARVNAAVADATGLAPDQIAALRDQLQSLTTALSTTAEDEDRAG